VATVLVISASFGGGHDMAARRLATRLAAHGLRSNHLDLVDLLPGGLGRAMRTGYRIQLGVAPRTWTWMCDLTGRRSSQLPELLAYLGGERVLEALTPDTVAVVSTYPLASQMLGVMRRRGELPVPVATVLTDVAVHPLWIADGVDAHLAPHAITARAARRLGAAAVSVCAPTVPPAFRPAEPGEREAAREAFGLPAKGRLALIVTGSWGVGQFIRSARDVAATGIATPVVACGRNRRGRLALRASGHGIGLGWTDDMPTLMRACDVVLHSAAGVSTQEALACGRPVITYRPLPGHGRDIAAALQRARLARWVTSPDRLGAGLTDALHRKPATWPGGADAAKVIADLAAAPVLNVAPALAPAAFSDLDLVPAW
jgi:UDP-N-acetylglucosamine:LPS N-acetylglucosamine transferase